MVWLSILACQIAWAWNPNQPLDRPYTLRNRESLILEREYHRMLAGERPRTYAFPRPCVGTADSSRVCGDTAMAGNAVGITPLGEAGWSYRDENAFSLGLGLLGHASAGPLSMALDARLYSERHEDPLHPSPDREPIDRQDEEASGSVAYSSFSRYRADFSFDWPWGRLSTGRDAAHWGPALYGNLVLHRDAIPFNQLSFTAHFGPFIIRTLYGQLAVEGDRIFGTRPDTRSLYAHRYEWNAGRHLLLGVSETLIAFDHEEPFAFLPLVPLFISKSDGWERLNNGNIAADLNLRLPGLASLYSEFLIDDIQSPTSLFDDQWGNKWGWLAGAHFIRDLGTWSLGAVTEYARLEPWVYTHYEPGTAQSANLGHPLGNQNGPNSQSLTLSAYGARGSAWFLSLRSDWIWAGTDLGSEILDSHVAGQDRKEFLRGVDSPKWRGRISVARNWRRWGAEAAAGRGADGLEAALGLRAWY